MVERTQPLARNGRLEQELFSGASSGINFDRYEDIPVEATGTDVPEGIESFDQVRLTPVIKAWVNILPRNPYIFTQNPFI